MDGRHCTHLGYKRTRYEYRSPRHGYGSCPSNGMATRVRLTTDPATPSPNARLEKLQANDLPAVEPRRLPAADRRRRLAQRVAEHDGCLRPMLEEIDHRRSLACCE